MSEFQQEDNADETQFLDCIEFTESDRVEVIDDTQKVDRPKLADMKHTIGSSDDSRLQVNDELKSQFENNLENQQNDNINSEMMQDYTSSNISKNDVVEKNIDKAMMCKEEGNDFYRSKEYDNAVEMYSQAINLCPEDENDPNYDEHNDNFAVFLGNRAAAFYALKEWDMVVDDCNWALDKKTNYVKIIVRRCQALEELNRFEEAMNDAKNVKELDHTWPKIDLIIARLQKSHDKKMEEMKEEAMGKLKELGNSLLGNFGMSLDNFKFEQDPHTGSYSVGTK